MTIAEIIQILILCAIFVQTVISYQALRLANKSLRADHERRKKQSTVEYLNSIRERFRPLRDFLDHEFGVDNPVNMRELSEESRNQIREFLSVVEHLATGINTGVYDIGILEKMSGSYFLGVYDRLIPYIRAARDRKPGSKFYIEFEHMCEEFRDIRGLRLKRDESADLSV